MEEEYLVYDDDGSLLGKFSDVDSLYSFVLEKTKDGKKVKIKSHSKVYFLL
ncbi:hypothetical protein [Acidianus sp. HS-5]|uniref:hypothetical protein n=1 Tax=Acidianus sp. HS-5 TaxID=2886040 RepID=UPI001F357E97|nr:hypothetical protein [Acidianus sp. HS-5]BDC18602.1 hypothetical protein HS5_14920 [Acidianus sp. HS-5]